jgi:HEPN domain-containing protein
MQPDARRESERWLAQARHDLDDARFCLGGARLNLACFVSQQAAEKALKAFLYARNEEPWGHSVAELCKTAALLDASFGPLLKDAAPLDKFYIPTRYPSGLPGGIPAEAFSQADAEAAVSGAELVITHAARAIEALTTAPPKP